MTLVEILITAALAMVVIELITTLLRLSGRMLPRVDRSGVRAALEVLVRHIVRDLRQIGPGPAGGEPVVVEEHSLAFHQVRFADQEIRLRPVRYRLELRPGGSSELVREEIAGGGILRHPFRTVPLSRLRFELHRDPRSDQRYLVVELEAAVPSGAPAASLAFSVPVRIPPGLGNPALAACTRVPDPPPFPAPGP